MTVFGWDLAKVASDLSGVSVTQLPAAANSTKVTIDGIPAIPLDMPDDSLGTVGCFKWHLHDQFERRVDRRQYHGQLR